MRASYIHFLLHDHVLRKGLVNWKNIEGAAFAGTFLIFGHEAHLLLGRASAAIVPQVSARKRRPAVWRKLSAYPTSCILRIRFCLPTSSSS